MRRPSHLTLLALGKSPFRPIRVSSIRRGASIRIAPSFLLEYPLRTDQAVGDIRRPVRLIHRTRDTLIPLADRERLRALVRSPVELVAVAGAGHDDIQRFPGYLQPLAQRLPGIR